MRLFPSIATITSVSVLCILGLVIAPASNAQDYLPSGSLTVNDDAYIYSVISVGQDMFGNTTDGMGNPYFATLDITDGAIVYGADAYNASALTVSGGNMTTVNCFNTSTFTMTGGDIDGVNGFNSNTLTICGGSVDTIYGGGTSTFSISGGNIIDAEGYDSSTFSISGGSVTEVYIGSSTFSVGGGTISNGLLVGAGATVNFLGSNVLYSYKGYGNSNPYGRYADGFHISGFFGGVDADYDLYILNFAYGEHGEEIPTTPNSTPRQFSPIAAAIVPEASTASLVASVMALPIISLVRRASRRKRLSN